MNKTFPLYGESPRKVHVNAASKEEKEEFKKRSNKYLWMLETKNKNKKKDFAIVSTDESFLFYDSLVRRV